jgi:photosystem II stability/assembly factor-like uncharacterized protein
MNRQIGRALPRCFLAGVFLLIAMPCAIFAGSYTWTTAGPEPGMVMQIVVNPQNSNSIHLISGYYGSLLFETADQGDSWRENEALSFANRLVQDPTAGSVVYTLTSLGGISGLFKSLDGGKTWFAANTGLPTSMIVALAPSATQRLYAAMGGSPGSVYRSDDGAGSWSLVSNAFPGTWVGDVIVDPFDPDVVYAATSPGLLKSVDGGATWVPGGTVPALTRLLADPTATGVLYGGTNDSGVYKSLDGGATWIPANTGIDGHFIRDIALDPSNPQKLFAASNGSAATGGGGLFVTTNGGQLWQPVDLGEPVNLATAVTIALSDPSLVYAAASQSVLRGGVFRSRDGGTTWERADSGLSGYYSYAIAPNPVVSGAALAVSGNKLFRTDSRGADWTLRGTTEFALTSLVSDPADPNVLYSAFGTPDPGGEGVYKSLDGGATWDPATNGLSVDTLHRLSVAPSAGDHVLAATFNGLFGTSNGGDLWAPLHAGDVRAAAFDPADPDILYAGFSANANEDGLLRSHDGGLTWNPPGGLPSSYLRVSDVVAPPADPSAVYVAGGTQGVFRSGDRGLTFTPASAGLPGAMAAAYRFAPDPTTPQTLYLFTFPGGAALPATTLYSNVYRTSNAASSWKPLPGYVPTLTSVLDFAPSSDGRVLYASTISGVFQFERSFADVPDADPFWPAVDVAALNGVTAGCGGGNFCPRAALSRASVAVFLVRGIHDAVYLPPPATGTVFSDVPADLAAAGYIEELASLGITSGCGGGAYCPSAPVTRAQFAVLLLKAEHGADYEPPPATGAVFVDVPADAFAAAWIEQLAAEGVTAGCGGGNFCPGDSVLRAQAAAMVVRALGLS